METDVVAGLRGREEYQKQKGQVETDVVAGSRGWEEYQRKFPHLAYNWRRNRSESALWQEWLAGGEESECERLETMMVMREDEPYNKKVEKWLRRGGGQEVEMFYSD